MEKEPQNKQETEPKTELQTQLETQLETESKTESKTESNFEEATVELVKGDCSKYKIGLRNIKTAIAVFLCLLVHFIVGPEMGLYACFAAVVCMRETVGQLWQIGWHRFLGTLIGGALGFFLITIAQKTPYYEKGLYLIIIPVGLVLCIWLCTLIDKKNGVVICCVVFIGIGLEADFDKVSTLYHVAIRIVDTTIGIVVAGLVNKYVFPYKEEDHDCVCTK